MMSKPKHHIRQEVCSTRAPYRDGRKPTAVKVYTVHQESKYLLIQGVSAVGATNELVKLFETVGDVEEHRILDDYPSEQFTEVYLIKYKRIQSARFAKRKLDDWSFYGGVLHVCYAPEFETVQETREKLRERRRVVEAKSRQYKTDGTYANSLSQVSQSSNSNTEEEFDIGSSQHHTASIESSYSNRTEETSQSNSTYITTDTPSSEQVLRQTSTHPDIQQYGVQLQYNTVNSNTFYGGQSVASQQNVNSYSAQTAQNNSGSSNVSIEQYGKKAHHPGTSLSYGEQVVQQARSLQNYGKSSLVKIENRLKRPNLDEVPLTVVPLTVNENVKNTHNLTQENEEQLILPPPPKQMRSSDCSFIKVQKYSGAKVPSAQATFPANFDARTDRLTENEDDTKIKDSKGYENTLNEIDKQEELREDLSKKSMQEKVEENLKNRSVVIKDFSKKGTVPKFIPRQAQIKNKLERVTDKIKTGKEASKTDELNREIRKNAFKLGKAQGPADLGPSTSNESLDPKEKSVIDSMLEIRKKLTKVKD
ncbi:uncharacterized protein LOC123530991 [Mercenaria mercenaria]|uniref:uncharacterized protein LOC123530991 n=1 Tax=Mercenaria mercenaria TaxID=6596 RepID=UPI00234E6D7C|nr:uncharacterized protein LOC123530991 [Mercenaria mercenaria]